MCSLMNVDLIYHHPLGRCSTRALLIQFPTMRKVSVHLELSRIMRKNGFKTSSSPLMQYKDSVGLGSVSLEEESASKVSSMGKKSSKASSSQLMQPRHSVGSLSHQEKKVTVHLAV